MLNLLRSSVKNSPYLKWILMAVGVGLIAYLGNYFVGNDPAQTRTDWVARVNESDIPGWRVREVARNLDQYYRDLFGANYDQIKPQLQIPRQAGESLIEKELVLQDARRLGLGTSPAELADRIRNHPSLRDASGMFIGKERYKRMLDRNYPGGYVAFERSLSEELLEAQWTALVTQPVMVDDAELEEIFRSRTEKTEIDYVMVPAAEQRLDRDPDDDALRGWYDGHLDDYMREAGQDLRYVVIEREALLERIEVADDEIVAYYEANQTTYRHPEQRRARHILFRLEAGAPDEGKAAAREKAEATLARLQAGEKFAALARELSEDPVSAARGGDLDFFGRDQMVAPFADAAFSTPVGEYAPITDSPFGVHLIEVTDSRPAGVSPLADVQDDIRRLVRFRQIDERLSGEAQRIEEAIGTADRLESVAGQEGLTVESAFCDPSDPIPALRPSLEFAEAVGSLEPGQLSSPLRVGAGLALVVVDEVTEAAPAPFYEVRASVLAAFVAEHRGTAALEAARAASERHPDLAAVARSLGREVQSSGELAPGQAPPEAGGITPELEASLFQESAAEGDGGVAEVPLGAIVYRITRREPFDPQRFAREKAGLGQETLQSRRQQHRQAILNQMKLRHRVEYNAAWLESLEGQS